MAELTPDSQPLAIPDHELIRPIGRGSYGQVWLARSILGEYRAVKIIRRSSFDHDRPVERELEGIQKFEPISRSHENQMHILHVGRFVDGFYYVMELADPVAPSRPNSRGVSAGSMPELLASPSQKPDYSNYLPRTLRTDMERRGRLPIDECLEIALKLTDALAHLHGHGLVHRDVKPSNIIFVRGQPKLADIGLIASSDSSLSCVGTEGFLPPEGPGRPQADLYALGKVLYEISTGRDRHDFPELPTLLRDDPERRALEELNEVILKACDPDPRRRYGTAKEMRADLECLRAGRSLQKVRRRERYLRYAGRIAAGLAAVALLIGVASSRWRHPQEPTRPLPVSLTIDGAEFWRVPWMPRQFDFSPDGERIVFAGTNQVSLWERRTRVTRRLELRGIPGWTVAGVRGAQAMPRWSPDGRSFVFQGVRKLGGADKEPILAYALLLVDADTGQARRIGAERTDAERARDLCWRPDGKALTYVFQTRRLRTLSLSGEEVLWKESDHPARQRLALGGYSADGEWLLFSADNGDMDRNEKEEDIWAMPHLGGPSRHITQAAGVEVCPAWSPDQNSIYYTSDGGRLHAETWGVWKLPVDRETMLPTGPPREVLVKHGTKFLHPRFLGNGRTLAYAVQEPRTRVWIGDPTGWQGAAQLVSGRTPVLSPDGKLVYFVVETEELQGIFAIDRNGSAASLRRVCQITPLSSLSLSPDGQLLAFLGRDGDRLGIFTVPSEGGPAHLLEPFATWEEVTPMWSPDGLWLAYTRDKDLIRQSRDGSVREVLASVYRWQGWTIRWSPDGQRLAGLADAKYSPTEDDSAIYVVSVADRTWKPITPESEKFREKEGVSWHPSGEFLTYMFYGPERFAAQIRRAYPDGRPTDLLIQQTNHWDYIGVWNPNGRQFLFKSWGPTCPVNAPDLHLYDSETRQITHHLRSGSLPSWSRDAQTSLWTTEETLRSFELVENASW